MTREWMPRLLALLETRHAQLEEMLSRAAAAPPQDGASAAFDEFAALLAKQMREEEQMLALVCRAQAGELAFVSRDHQKIRQLSDEARQLLRAGDWSGFANTAQALLIRLSLHMRHEERLLQRSDPTPAAEQAAHRFLAGADRL